MNFRWRARARFVAAFLLAAPLPACFGEGWGGGSEPPVATPSTPRGEGRIFIAWTIGGAPPSADSCAGVDHLALQLEYEDGRTAIISPIPCTLDRFRYDALPEGRAALNLVAVGTRDCRLAEATVALVVTTDLPSTPSPRPALPLPSPCR